MGTAHTTLRHESRAVADAPRPARSTVQLVGISEIFSCAADETLLHALTRGHRRPVSSGCHAGGCGVCRIRVVTGAYRAAGMSRAHVDEVDAAEDIALACRTWPLGDLVIEPLGKLLQPRGGVERGPTLRRHLPTDTLEVWS